MNTIHELLIAAVAHHQAGRLDEAKQLYRQVLAADPQQANAWHLLGLVASASGRNDIAVDYIQRAIAIADSYAEFHASLGAVHQSMQNLDAAAAALEAAIARKPHLAMAHYNLGVVRQEQGRTADAIAAYRQALAIEPRYEDARFNLAVLTASTNLDEAATGFEEVLRLNPRRASAHRALGSLRAKQGRLDDALASYQRALELEPDSIDALLQAADLHERRKDWDQVESCYRRVLELSPNDSRGIFGLGLVEQSRQNFAAAEARYRQFIDQRRESAAGWNNLGQVVKNLRRDDEAIAIFRHALELDGNLIESLSNLGHLLMNRNLYRDAAECYQRIVDISPETIVSVNTLLLLRLMMCQWELVADLTRRVLVSLDSEGNKDVEALPDPLMFLSLPTPTTPALQYRVAKQWADHYYPPRHGSRKTINRNRSHIRVGYIAADFYEHPVAALAAGLIEEHDRSQFEVWGYSYGKDDRSEMRRRLEAGFDRFIDLEKLTVEDCAAQIAGDEIDILVDLTGNTFWGRPQIMALRPAPVQVNYLGYPGTMGSTDYDYILVDEVVVPEAEQPYFSERLVHLPGCYQANDRKRRIEEPPPERGTCGLPARGFVFCNFNNTFKITPPVFDVWMRLLHAVPGSVLWLHAANEYAPPNLVMEAARRGIPAERIVFAPRWPSAQHLARYRLADLFLDTMPYNSHTTGSDALWAGCPGVTVLGNSFPARVAASQFRTLGLDELITANLAEYEALALDLARNPERLAAIRARLAASRETSSLFDTPRFTCWIEEAFRTMWSIAHVGEDPRAFRIPDG